MKTLSIFGALILATVVNESLQCSSSSFENEATTTPTPKRIPKILVVAGYTRGHYTRKTEIWSQPETRCTLPRFPLNTYGAMGFWTAQGPTVCGGHVSESGGGKKCFVLNKEHQWMPIPSLTTDRVYASATEVNNDETLIIGGYYGNALKTTELISSSGSVKGKDFPTTVYGHCAIKINSTHGLVIGGKQDGSYSASTWFVDLTTTTFTPGPPMKIKRMYHGCTTFNLGTKTFGIVSGGLNNGKEVRLDSTEIIDLDQNHPTWTEGPNLPRRLNYVTLVETTQGTFAIAQ